MERLTLPGNPDRIKPNSKETEVITLFADIRRESAELKKFTLTLATESGDLEQNQELISEIKQESDGVNILSREEAEQRLLKVEKNYLYFSYN